MTFRFNYSTIANSIIHKIFLLAIIFILFELNQSTLALTDLSSDEISRSFHDDFSGVSQIFNSTRSNEVIDGKNCSVLFGVNDMGLSVAKLIFPGGTTGRFIGPGYGPLIETNNFCYYGTYKAKLKASASLNGGDSPECEGIASGFFNYWNGDGRDENHNGIADISEIDIEILKSCPQLINMNIWTDSQIIGDTYKYMHVARIVNLDSGRIWQTPSGKENGYELPELNYRLPQTISGFDASKNYYEYGFTWNENFIRFFIINENGSEIELWKYEDKEHIPHHPAKMVFDIWHTSDWKCIDTTYCKDVGEFKPPKDDVTLSIDWAEYTEYLKGWRSHYGYITSNPSVTIDAQGRNHFFAIGGDRTLWDNIDGTWYNLGGYVTSDPYAVKDYQGRLHIFVRGGDYALYDNVFNTSSLSSYWLPLGGYITSNPSASLASNGHLIIAVRGGDNALWIKDLDTTSMASSWISLGGYITSNPYTIYDPQGKRHTLALGGDYGLWDNVDGFWQCRGGYLTSDAKPILDPNNHNIVRALARGGDGGLWMNSYNAITGAAEWDSLGGYILSKEDGSSIYTATPEPVSNADGTTHVYVIGGDRSLWEKVLSGTGGVQWNNQGGFITSNPCSGIPENSTIQQVGVRGGDNALWVYN